MVGLDRTHVVDNIFDVTQDTPEEPVVTMCHHVFCYQCVSEYLTGDDNMCPEAKCKEQLIPDAVYTKSTLRDCISEGGNVDASSLCHEKSSVIMHNKYISSKIKRVVDILKTHCVSKEVGEGLCLDDKEVLKHAGVYSSRTEGPPKLIMFSQWTGMLNLVEVSLNHFCIEYRRLDGTMGLAARDKAVRDFNTDPEVNWIINLSALLFSLF